MRLTGAIFLVLIFIGLQSGASTNAPRDTDPLAKVGKGANLRQLVDIHVKAYALSFIVQHQTTLYPGNEDPNKPHCKFSLRDVQWTSPRVLSPRTSKNPIQFDSSSVLPTGRNRERHIVSITLWKDPVYRSQQRKGIFYSEEGGGIECWPPNMTVADFKYLTKDIFELDRSQPVRLP